MCTEGSEQEEKKNVSNLVFMNFKYIFFSYKF